MMLFHSGGKTATPLTESTNSHERNIGQENLDPPPLTPEASEVAFTLDDWDEWLVTSSDPTEPTLDSDTD